jgi:hypothetical protein
LLAEAAGKPTVIPDKVATLTYSVVGTQQAGYFQYQTLYARILKEQPDFLE